MGRKEHRIRNEIQVFLAEHDKLIISKHSDLPIEKGFNLILPSFPNIEFCVILEAPTENRDYPSNYYLSFKPSLESGLKEALEFFEKFGIETKTLNSLRFIKEE